MTKETSRRPPQNYTDAFYDIASLFDIPAQSISPMQAYEKQMRPRIVRLLELERQHG